MKSITWLFLVIVVMLSACQSATPSPTTVVQPVGATSTPIGAEMPSPYPPPDSTINNSGGYPEPLPTIGSESYPSPQQAPTQDTGGTQSTTPETITWDDAQSRILNGQVDQIVQHQDLTVTLTLKDGTLVQTTEPKIDDVIHLLEQCGDNCSNIKVTTE